MLHLTGFVDNKEYTDTPMKAEELLSLFNSPLDLKRKDAVFTLLKNRTKNDPVNKRIRHQRVRQFNPLIEGTYKGNFVQIRYFERKRKDGNNNDVYYPPRVKHIGIEMKMKTAQHKEVIAFLALHGACKDSPIQTVATQQYEITDKQRQAREALNRETMLARLIVNVKDAPKSQIYRLAHALSLSGRDSLGNRHTKLSVTNVSSSSIDQLRADLIRIAKILPKEFAAAFKDQEILLRGMIKEALDKGVLEQHNMGGGVVSWKWRHDVEAGVDIVSSSPGQDPFAVLYNYALRSDVFAHFSSTINATLGYEAAVANMDVQPHVLSKAVTGADTPSSMSNSAIIEEVFVKEKIFFDRVNKKVFILKDGEIKGKALLNIGDPSKWKEELGAAMDRADVTRNRILATLKK